MLRPEQMSRVSVTGSKGVMREVIEAVYDLNLLHLEDYDGNWDGFDPGEPIAGADEVSDRLVTVRSIESILAVGDLDAGPARGVDAYEEELEDIRRRVNELDDTRAELRDERRIATEARDAAEPFVALGIDLDLLSGYDSLTVRVGEGDEEAVRAALAAADGVDAFETFAADGVVAAFAAGAAAAVDEALVGAAFTAMDVPDADEPPEAYVADLEHEIERLDQRLRTVREELQELKLDAGRFLLAVEERLSIEAQKASAPLSFATTENAFVAEGWVPTDRVDALRSALVAAAGDHVEVEELERASYDADGAPHESEAVTDGGQDLRMGRGEPPVVMDNPGALRPFELLVQTISRPSYREFDPTVLVFLTFPTFFGFMIGDVGYGILYMAIGYWLFRRFDSAAIRSLGGVAIWAGFFTFVFGVLYGEFFGLHVLGEAVWGGHPPMEKGLEATEFALVWLFVALVLGLVHVGTGYVLGFVNTVRHSVVEAVLEYASWFLLMVGVWVWILSVHYPDPKPEFIFTLFNQGEAAVYPLGFAGFSAGVGLAGLGVGVLGLGLMIAGEVRHEGGLGVIIGSLESLNVLVNVLSYARIPAVLLAKAGMAFVVNLLVFGVYHGHFALTEAPEEGIGLIHGGIGSMAVGIVVLVVGHLIVLGLGITSAGLQAIRLEYVEFFQKFYEGGGEPYEPFGYRGRSG